MSEVREILWGAGEVADVTKGTLQGDWGARSVSIDSRTMQQDALFVALKGDRFDGHDYVAQALENGAAAAMVSDVPDGVDANDSRLLRVDDTELGLQALGRAARARSAAKIVGVTGSVGKTGAKEMLRSCLSAVGRVYATQGNLNNHLGVPLSLANMPRNIDYGVFEMGMNHAGEMRQLSHWVRPHISLITTIEEAHMEFFNGIEEVADAKAEIFEGMGGEGVAVLNMDNGQYERLYGSATRQGLDRVLSFGTQEGSVCRMVQYGMEGLQSVVDAEIAGTPVAYRIGALGKHWGLISVAVLGVVDALQADLPRAAAALEHFVEPKGRGRISQLPVKGGYLRLIDDSYNASPASMRSAFEKLHMLQASSPEPTRTVAVLGDMLEMGEGARDLHVGLVPSLVNNHIDLVFAAGDLMRNMYDALPDDMRGAYDVSASQLTPKLLIELKNQDIVLVKGSHGSRMHEVVDAIEQNAHDLDNDKRKGNS